MLNKKGFTLIELIVSMTILVILTTIGFLSVRGWTASARDSVRIDDINNITTAIDLYNLNRGKYPEPSDSVDITHSGATVWTQGGFGKDTIRQTGRIFGQLKDPGYDVDYTYSVTNSRREYQLSYFLEDRIDNLTSAVDLRDYDLLPSTYASGDFSPNEFNPTIWLDASDVDGDGDNADNPIDNSDLTAWINKSAVGAANNPTITNGELKYATSGYDGSYPGVYIAANRGLRLDNSAISSGDIFYVVQNNDPFGDTDNNGIGLQATSGNYLIGYSGKFRNALRINSSPSHYASSPATKSNRTDAFIYGYHTDSGNYSFRDTGNVVSQGAASSISGREWAFNRAGASNARADFVVSEILIYSSSLSAGDREKVEGYLAHKWGQQSVLPANHPYKNAPPEGGTPPPAPDTTPDAFVFNSVTNATLSTQYTSNAITVTGTNTSSPIDVVGGEYSINSTTLYVTGSGSVNEGDVIRVRQTSSSSNTTTTSAVLTIGGVSSSYDVTTLNADTEPDPFSFNTIGSADISTAYASDSITVTGINTGVPITISGGDAEYRISSFIPYDTASGGTSSASSTKTGSTPGEAFDNNLVDGWGSNNTLPVSLSYDLGSGNAEVVNSYTFYRGSSQPGIWKPSYSPQAWRFEGSNDNSNWDILDSQTNEYIYEDASKKQYRFNNTNSYRYYRIYITASNADDSSDWVNITEMELINEGNDSYTSANGTVNNGDIVTVLMTSPPTAGSTETATLTIGSGTPIISSDYSITAVSPDTIPDSYAFTDVNNAVLNTPYTSNTITVSGINSPASISISSTSGTGEYNINGGAFTSGASTVNNGDIISIRQTSAASESITVSSTLDIGTIARTYNVTTSNSSADTIPDPFTFLDVTDANLSTEYESISIMVSGINQDTSISISGGQYDINGAGSYTNATGIVSNGDIVTVKNTSSPIPGNTVEATLTIGGVPGESDTFSITSVEPDNIPDPYTLGYVTDAFLNRTYNSAPVLVTGINVPTPIDIRDGGGKYSINGGDFQTGEGEVFNGDIVIVHLQSLVSENKKVGTELTIGPQPPLSGGITRTFDITTLLADDTNPDTFTFNDVTDANLNTVYTDTITVSGINTGTGITITDEGEYSINSGSYTTNPGTVYNGDTVTVRLNSSADELDSVNANVTIGGISDIYTVTTLASEVELSTVVDREPSNVYVTGNFNGLFSHGVSSTNGNHYVFITPSIITTDTTDTDFLNVINDKKFVYTGYHNYPATYTAVDSNLTQTGGFDQYRISGPIIFEGNKQDLTSYAGIKQVDNGVRSTYRTTELYRQSARYLDNYGTAYVEEILGNVVGINPIKPYYCSDILDREFTQNIADLSTITATQNTLYGGVSGTGGIANGIKSTETNLDNEYHSDTINAFINFEWEEDQPVGFIRIYNRTLSSSSRLSGATISLYDGNNTLLYTHTLWDTTNDYVVDLDLEGIGQLYENVRRVTIRGQGPNSYLNLREVEIYVGGTIENAFYLVDSDGIGGQRPYEVYCDMTTDGGGWTKIGDNHVLNGSFSDGDHALDYSLIWNNENQIVPITNPSGNQYAIRQRALSSGYTEIDYDIVFDDVQSFQVDSELRLSAWVADAWDEGDSINGGKGYIFNNRLTYTDGSFVENGEKTTLDTQSIGGKLWKLEMVRIPITKEVESFVWQVGNGTETSASRDFYFADLKAEIYYK